MKTEVRNHNGLPTLFIDALPHHGLWSSAPPEFMRNVLDAGFDIVDTHPLTSIGWTGPDTYDYADTDRRIESYLVQSRDAKLIVRFWLGYPQKETEPKEEFWWMAQHPEENVRPFPVSEGHPMPWDEVHGQLPLGQLIAIHNGHANASVCPARPPRPSFASLLFREQAGDALRRVVAHIEAKYGERIVGYVTGGGPCGEWFHWSADDPRMMDYSAPMRRTFHAYLSEHYGDVAALNRTWNSHFADFSEINPPTPEQRFHATHGNLRSEPLERHVIDFFDAYHRALSDTLLHWVTKTKEGCARRKVVMVFYGYLWHHAYGDAPARFGHAHLNAVLRSPDVDAVVSPFCYSFRQMDGVMTGQGLAASARLHGKLYVHELDGSTNLITCWNCPDHHNPQTPEETGELFRRELNKMLCEGSAGWYMDLRGGYYDSPAVVAELKKTLEAGSRARPEAGRPNTHVAVVLDPRSSFYFREGEPLLAPLVDAFKQHSLARMGLGFDDFSLEDLDDLPVEATARYKFWIFPCAVHLSEKNLTAIRRHACRKGNHVLWNYAVNVCGRNRPDLDAMERATGFRCGVSMEPGELAVTVPPGKHPWTMALKEKLVYGTRGDLSPDDIKYHAILGMYATSEKGFQISPRFFIEAGGETIGTLNDLPGQPAGLATRPMEGWVSVLSCAPLLPHTLLREIARAAGCHVYADFPGQVVQCENHVGMFFHADGPCPIRLPYEASRVVELYSGREVARHCDEFIFEARKNHAVLFHWQSA
ncbi:MAG: beta-galactosidase [Terrimicrobiaceae bacterium]